MRYVRSETPVDGGEHESLLLCFLICRCQLDPLGSSVPHRTSTQLRILAEVLVFHPGTSRARDKGHSSQYPPHKTLHSTKQEAPLGSSQSLSAYRQHDHHICHMLYPTIISSEAVNSSHDCLAVNSPAIHAAIGPHFMTHAVNQHVCWNFARRPGW